MEYQNRFLRNRPQGSSENQFRALADEFPDVPHQYILKVLSDLAGSTNIKNALQKESEKIKQRDSEDWVKHYFKAFPCKHKDMCNNPYCFDYHYIGEKRRIFKYKRYEPELCENFSQCAKLDDCEFAHNTTEIWYHPSNYRSSICPYAQSLNSCIYKETCPFSHEGNDEIQVFQEFKDCHNELDKLSKELSRVEEEIKFKLKEQEDLSKKLRCVCGNRIEFIRAPCGHGACRVCNETPACKKCGKESRVVQLAYA